MPPVPEHGGTLAEILTHPSAEGLIDAIDRNCIDFFQHYGYGPGCELHDEEGVEWFVTGIRHPLFNGVMTTRLSEEDTDGRIDDLVKEFQRRGLELEWTTGSGTQPPDMGHRLKRKGFEHSLDVPGMATDLRNLPEEPIPRGVEITRARTHADLEACIRIALTTFGIPEGHTQRLLEIEEGMPPEQKACTYHYLARLDGRPVATSELFLAAGVAGLYFVGTLEGARGRGIARAVTLAALQEAEEAGYRIGTLQATVMGVPVYRRIGFREHMTMGIYLKA